MKAPYEGKSIKQGEMRRSFNGTVGNMPGGDINNTNIKCVVEGNNDKVPNGDIYYIVCGNTFCTPAAYGLVCRAFGRRVSL